MIISETIHKNLLDFEKCIDLIIKSNSLTDVQLENFLKTFERIRYNLLSEIKIYNKNVKYKYEKIKTIDDEYNADINNNVLKIYIPEIIPSYKNLKTHTYKRILLNVAELTKKYEGLFKEQVFIYIKVFDSIGGWDIDNKCIKPIADALILSGVIQDDNITKMFYCVKGEYSESPHSEIYISDSKNINEFLEKYST